MSLLTTTQTAPKRNLNCERCEKPQGHSAGPDGQSMYECTNVQYLLWPLLITLWKNLCLVPPVFSFKNIADENP